MSTYRYRAAAAGEIGEASFYSKTQILQLDNSSPIHSQSFPLDLYCLKGYSSNGINFLTGLHTLSTNEDLE
jgi:hypothetical protein